MAKSHQEKLLATSIVEFLDAYAKTSATPDQSESLQVALDCINDVFGLGSLTAEQKLKLSVRPLHLQQIFDAGLGFLVDNQPKMESQSEFKAFVDEVTRRGYFADVKEGTLEYQQRWDKLKEKFTQARPLHSAAAVSHGGAAGASSVSADDELKQQQQRMSQAEQLKNEGNTLMQSKNYEGAIAACATELKSLPFCFHPSFCLLHLTFPFKFECNTCVLQVH
jgi:hypothetical protein